MSHLSGSEKSRYVRHMFSGIAGHYDLLNRLMTFGQDQRWRREAIMMLEVKSGARYLDEGAGTGDIALAISRQFPRVSVVACDLTPEMIAIGRKRAGGMRIMWVIADAQYLPFAGEGFTGVISGYLLRNVGNLEQTLGEQYRVLHPAGKVVSLDTTPPRKNWLHPFIIFYLRRVIPFLGRLFTGNSAAYAYLPRSTEQFLSAEKLTGKLRDAGFSAVSSVHRMAGTMAIHKAQK